jgi:hypothetical protein
MKLRREVSFLKQALSEGDEIPMWWGIAWVEPINGMAVCYPYGLHLLIRWAYLGYFSIMAPRRTNWELKLRAVRDEGWDAGLEVGRRYPDFDGVFVFNRAQVNVRIANAVSQANQIKRIPQDVAYKQGYRIGYAEAEGVAERRALREG